MIGLVLSIVGNQLVDWTMSLGRCTFSFDILEWSSSPCLIYHYLEVKSMDGFGSEGCVCRLPHHTYYRTEYVYPSFFFFFSKKRSANQPFYGAPNIVIDPCGR